MADKKKEQQKVEEITTCPECGSDHIQSDYERGEMVCETCGLVLDDGLLRTGLFAERPLHDFVAHDEDLHPGSIVVGALLDPAHRQRDVDRAALDQVGVGTAVDQRENGLCRCTCVHMRICTEESGGSSKGSTDTSEKIRSQAK